MTFEESAGANGATMLRAKATANGKALEWKATLFRPKTPSTDAALFIDISNIDVLKALALSRGMIVMGDFSSSPAISDLADSAFGAFVAALKKRYGVKRVLMRLSGEQDRAALRLAPAVDGVLVEHANPFASAIDVGPAKVIEFFGAEEYWRVPARRGEGPAEVNNRRRFFVSGETDFPPPALSPRAANACTATVDFRKSYYWISRAARALFVALDDWTKGVKPPPSRVPAAGDLVKASALQWPKISDLPKPPNDDRLVPKIDADGNETSGLKLPDHALPITTFTGFNSRGGERGDCPYGATIPFAATKAEREKTGDPRPSLVERYGSRAYFVATMRVVADKLVKERLLLKEDADAYVTEAKNAPF